MYLNIGKEVLLHNDEILGIFSLPYVRNTREYKNMYKELEENGKLFDLSNKNGDEKVFILTEKNSVTKGYISKVGLNTVLKRLV